MNPLFNKILLSRQQKVVISKSTGKTSKKVILGIIAEIAQLGFTLNGNVIEVLKTLSDGEIKVFRNILIDNLREMVGAHVKYRPLFKNFPNDIPDDETFLLKRIVGFIENSFPHDLKVLSCGHAINPLLFDLDEFNACPICLHQVDELQGDKVVIPLTEVTPLKIISLGTDSDVFAIFTNLLAAKSSISESDKEVVSDLVEALKDDVGAYIPSAITLKENIALLAGLLIKHTAIAENVLSQHVGTATGVLRIAAQLSGGDISLKEVTRFKLRNAEKNIIMSLLNNVASPLEDMKRYRSRWLRLGEVVHIGEKKKRFPNAYEAFDIIRNSESDIVTFNSKVEREIKSLKLTKRSEIITPLLKERPGEFARRLDIILRNTHDYDVVSEFNAVISKVSNSILLNLMGYFKSRDRKSAYRAFIPKGNVAKVKFIEGDDREVISAGLIDNLLLVINSELIRRYAEKEPMGSIYIDPAMKKRVIPSSQRSATKALNTITRGSRISFSETNTLRMFLYWKENEKSDRVDVDLSAIAFGDDWSYKGHLSYTSLHAFDSVHSGDITSAPHGAAEFIDINVPAFKNKGVRYVVMNVLSFTGQPFNDYECLAGFMERGDALKGAAFEAGTVKNKFDVTGNATVNLPMIFDLQENEVVWADFSLTSQAHNNNVESNSEKIVQMSKVCMSLLENKVNLYDLLMLHAAARNAVVDVEKDDSKEYDAVFDESMALDDILANWM